MYQVESDKDAPINPFYLEPGSTGYGAIRPRHGPLTVFMDAEFRDGYEDGTFHPRLTYTAEPVLKDHYGAAYIFARDVAEAAVGTRHNARFYEKVLADLLGENIDIKHILTGVGTFGDYWHDLGYLAIT